MPTECCKWAKRKYQVKEHPGGRNHIIKYTATSPLNITEGTCDLATDPVISLSLGEQVSLLNICDVRFGVRVQGKSVYLRIEFRALNCEVCIFEMQ